MQLTQQLFFLIMAFIWNSIEIGFFVRNFKKSQCVVITITITISPLLSSFDVLYLKAVFADFPNLYNCCPTRFPDLIPADYFFEKVRNVLQAKTSIFILIFKAVDMVILKNFAEIGCFMFEMLINHIIHGSKRIVL